MVLLGEGQRRRVGEDRRVQFDGRTGRAVQQLDDRQLGLIGPNHAGGTHTYAWRGANFRPVPGMVMARVAPWSGSLPVLATSCRMAVSC